MKHIHESETGVMLEIDYVMDDKEIVFQSVHVLDANYQVVGPDMAEFLHDMFKIVQERPEIIGERFLSLMVAEIENEDSEKKTLG